MKIKKKKRIRKERGKKGVLRNDCAGNAVMRSADQLCCLCRKPRYCYDVVFLSQAISVSSKGSLLCSVIQIIGHDRVGMQKVCRDAL